jgi:hypothetical protein
MVKGEEHLPMSIMEYITDGPLEPMAFLDYAIKNVAGRLKYWRDKPEERSKDSEPPTTKECVVANLDYALFNLQEVKRKFEHWPR